MRIMRSDLSLSFVNLLIHLSGAEAKPVTALLWKCWPREAADGAEGIADRKLDEFTDSDCKLYPCISV